MVKSKNGKCKLSVKSTEPIVCGNQVPTTTAAPTTPVETGCGCDDDIKSYAEKAGVFNVACNPKNQVLKKGKVKKARYEFRCFETGSNQDFVINDNCKKIKKKIKKQFKKGKLCAK